MHVRPVILAVAVGVVVSTILGGILFIGHNTRLWTLADWVISWFRPMMPPEPIFAYRAQAAVAQLILAAPGILAAVLVHAWLRGRQPADRETRCRRCGYILRGITEPRCPECGERV